MQTREHEAKRVKLKQMCIRAGMHAAEVEVANKVIAHFFYANGLPFSAQHRQSNCRFTTRW